LCVCECVCVCVCVCLCVCVCVCNNMHEVGERETDRQRKKEIVGV
jgi:hypothetical protein